MLSIGPHHSPPAEADWTAGIGEREGHDEWGGRGAMVRGDGGQGFRREASSGDAFALGGMARPHRRSPTVNQARAKRGGRRRRRSRYCPSIRGGALRACRSPRQEPGHPRLSHSSIAAFSSSLITKEDNYCVCRRCLDKSTMSWKFWDRLYFYVSSISWGWGRFPHGGTWFVYK